MSQPPLGGGGGGQRSAQPFYIPNLMQQPQQPVVMTSGNGGAPITSSTSSFYMPTLMPSLQQQQQQQQQSVAITCSGNSVTPVITSSTYIQPGGPTTAAPVVSVIQQPPPVTTANLYLCTTSKNATDAPVEGDEGNTKKASIEMLEESYKQLNARKIKDSLSSFLPDIPGEFDSMESPETKLQHLLEQRVIGNKEFHPLSGHALLGFRLLPGPLPEQYRIDPPLQEPRSHHHKKKHKHRSIEKVGEDGSDLNPPSTKVKMPNDAYGVLKESSLLTAPSPSIHPPERTAVPPKVVPSGAHVYSPALTTTTVVGSSLMVGQDPMNPFPGGKKKKEKKRNKEKKKEKKEKKKKKDKHHGQDPPVGPAGAPQSTPHQHTHTHGGMT